MITKMTFKELTDLKLNMDIEKEIDKINAELPDALLPKIQLSAANETISIYKGKFDLITKDKVIEVNGEITFEWRPEARIVFKGASATALYLTNQAVEKIQIPGLDLEHGELRIVNVESNQMNGVISAPFVIKYTEETVDCFYFELPNFKETFGENVKKINSEGRFFSRARIEWEDKDYLIILDKLFDFENIYKQLKNEGGYALTHTGKIIPKSANLSHQQAKVLAEKLGLFLSFIKGRRSYPCFLQGFKDDKLCWIDYSAFHVDRHKDADSWLPQTDYSGIPGSWEGFRKLTDNEDDYQCVDFLLHWYFEANNNSGFVEGSIVLLQNAFELLYNWQVKEQKLDADKKIRKLLEQAQLPLGFHKDYSEMVQDLKSKKIQFNDFPKLFTLVRNAIVHSDKNKRTQLSKYTGLYRFYVKQIGLYHIELLLLHLFGYSGKVATRLPLKRYSGGNEEIVPWMTADKNNPKKEN